MGRKGKRNLIRSGRSCTLNPKYTNVAQSKSSENGVGGNVYFGNSRKREVFDTKGKGETTSLSVNKEIPPVRRQGGRLMAFELFD